MKYVVMPKYKGRPVFATQPMTKDEAEKLRAQLLAAVQDELWEDVYILERPE